MRGTNGLSVAAIAVAAMVVAPPAVAGQASYLGFEAGAGETNEVTVSQGPDLGIGPDRTWTDHVSPLSADFPHCVSRDQHTVFCRPLTPGYIQGCVASVGPRGGPGCGEGVISLGDMSDRVQISGESSVDWFVYGGPGDDATDGNSHWIDGGPGDDFLRGGRFVVGGAGVDRIMPGNGGDFVDAQTYRSFRVPPHGTFDVRVPDPGDPIVCGPGSDLVAADPNDFPHERNCDRVSGADQRAFLCPSDRFEFTDGYPTLRVRVAAGPVISSSRVFRRPIGEARRLARRYGCTIRVTHRDGEPLPRYADDRQIGAGLATIDVDLNSETRRIRYVFGLPGR